MSMRPINGQALSFDGLYLALPRDVHVTLEVHVEEFKNERKFALGMDHIQ